MTKEERTKRKIEIALETFRDPPWSSYTITSKPTAAILYGAQYEVEFQLPIGEQRIGFTLVDCEESPLNTPGIIGFFAVFAEKLK